MIYNRDRFFIEQSNAGIKLDPSDENAFYFIFPPKIWIVKFNRNVLWSVHRLATDKNYYVYVKIFSAKVVYTNESLLVMTYDISWSFSQSIILLLSIDRFSNEWIQFCKDRIVHPYVFFFFNWPPSVDLATMTCQYESILWNTVFQNLYSNVTIVTFVLKFKNNNV